MLVPMLSHALIGLNRKTLKLRLPGRVISCMVVTWEGGFVNHFAWNFCSGKGAACCIETSWSMADDMRGSVLQQAKTASQGPLAIASACTTPRLLVTSNALSY